MRRPPSMPPPPVPARSPSAPSSPQWWPAAGIGLLLAVLALLALLLAAPPGGAGRGDAQHGTGAAGSGDQSGASPSISDGQATGNADSATDPSAGSGDGESDGKGSASVEAGSATEGATPVTSPEAEAGSVAAAAAGLGANEAAAAAEAAPQGDAASAGSGTAAAEADAASAGGATSADPAEVPPRRTSGVLYTLPPVAAGTAGSAPAGDGNSADFFGVGATGKRFVYVVDKSSSMTGEKFAAARQELFRSIDQLHASQSFYIIFYDDQVHAMPGGFARGRRKDKQAAQQWCLRAVEMGGTNPTPAVVHGLEMRPDALFLLSDGEFDMLDVDRITAANSAERIPIHTIGFQANADTLREIAERNRGKYRYVR